MWEMRRWVVLAQSLVEVKTTLKNILLIKKKKFLYCFGAKVDFVKKVVN